MTIMNVSEKKVAEGIFWIVNDELLAFPFGTVNSVNGIAKSGNTYNHKLLWNDLRIDNKHPYNYYPRGRVVIDNKGRAVIYINHNIDMEYIEKIRQAFGIVYQSKIKIDNSEHYKCYLDEGWKPDNSK